MLALGRPPFTRGSQNASERGSAMKPAGHDTMHVIYEVAKKLGESIEGD